MKLKNLPSKDLAFLQKIGALAESEQTDVYVVGGYVRDLLLKKPCRDVDFVVVGDGPEFARKAREALNGHGYVVYPKFGTASFIKDDYKLEFVSARKESYRADSRKPQVEQSDLTDDLARRDFTVNTLAMPVRRKHFGKIVDDYHGTKDLKKQVIRTPLDPKTTFSEDPLRIMRAARFASQLHFKIDPKTLEAMRSERHRLEIVSQERISDEMLKMLSHPKPSIGFQILQDTGVLEIIFPELAILEGVEQRDDFHHKDVFEHTLKVLDNIAQLTDDPLLRFTALVHDIGKPKTKRFVKGTGWTFHGHELAGMRMLKDLTIRLKLPNDYYKYSEKLTRLHMRPIQLIGEEVTDSAIRRLLAEAGDDLENLMTLCRADITSGNPDRVKKHLNNFDYVTQRMEEVEEKDKMRAFQSPVRGEEIMQILGTNPGPLIGQIKKRIEEAILEGEIPNDYDAAHAYLLKIKDDYIK